LGLLRLILLGIVGPFLFKNEKLFEKYLIFVFIHKDKYDSFFFNTKKKCNLFLNKYTRDSREDLAGNVREVTGSTRGTP
jgi:hypothetical protein